MKKLRADTGRRFVALTAQLHERDKAVDARFDAFEAHVRAAWGLPVPRTLVAVQALFEAGEAESMAAEVVRGAEISPAGVLDRLAEGGLLAHPLPRQYEFGRLNLSYVITSKRKLKQLVDERHVSGWDDPDRKSVV